MGEDHEGAGYRNRQGDVAEDHEGAGYRSREGAVAEDHEVAGYRSREGDMGEDREVAGCRRQTRSCEGASYRSRQGVLLLIHFLLLLSPGLLVPATFRVGLLSPDKPGNTLTEVLMGVYQVIPNPVKLTMKLNYHNHKRQ